MKLINYRLIGLLFLLSVLDCYSQSTPEYFYYYKGEKVFLELDRQTISLSTEGNIDAGLFSKKGKVVNFFEDHTRTKVIPTDQLGHSTKGVKINFFEVRKDEKLSFADYQKEIETYKKITSVIVASPSFKTPEGKKMGLSNNLYAKLKSHEDLPLLYEQARALNLEVLGQNKFMPLWFTLACGKKTKGNALINANLLYETGLFDNVEPEFIMHDMRNSSDPLFNDQWGLKNTGQRGGNSGIDIKAEQAWQITLGSPIVRVAIFDEGFEMNHPDLQGNVDGTGYNVMTGASPSVVYGNHGTACAGIIGALQNSIGISGVAPNVRLVSISMNLSSVSNQNLADGFNWAAQNNNVDVISNSWGGGSSSSILDNAITNALINGRAGKGAVVVFSSGNNNSSSSNYPGNSNPLILNVGAIDRCGIRSGRIDIIPQSCDPWCSNCQPASAYGPTLDIMGFGTSVSTTDRQGSNGYNTNGSGNYSNLDFTNNFGGTSAACPSAAGVAALVLSANPNLTRQQVTDIIESTAQKVRTDLYTYSTTSGRGNGVWNNQMGYGLINAYAAVIAANPCLTDLTLTTNVTSPNFDQKEASNSITASNIINSGASASYHAGNTVRMTPGFRAASGSTFRAYIQGCTGTFTVQANSSPQNARINYNYEVDQEITEREKSKINVFPNPSSGIIKIQSALLQEKKVSIQIYDIAGNKIYDAPEVELNNENHEINLSSTPSGFYLMYLKTENSLERIKFTIDK